MTDQLNILVGDTTCGQSLGSQFECGFVRVQLCVFVFRKFGIIESFDMWDDDDFEDIFLTQTPKITKWFLWKKIMNIKQFVMKNIWIFWRKNRRKVVIH